MVALDEELVGTCKAFRELCQRLEQLKDVDSMILLLGESGTGKELVARALHKMSKRKAERFEAINCAAIPEQLLESELFGHKKGAFTDAKQDRKGIFEACTRGTLLLDEVGDMPLSLQAKILRVIQERRVIPVGGTQSIKIDTRLIAATHRDLREEIELGRFRADLYYRLSVVPINIPPLRQRKEDIPLLIEHFLNEFNRRFDRHITPPSGDLMDDILAYDWPGNIRELRNAIERAVILSPDGSLHHDDIFQHLESLPQLDRQGLPKGASTSLSHEDRNAIPIQILHSPLTEAKQIFEKIYLESLLRETHGNISEASKRAGRYRADLYRLLARYKVELGTFR